MPAKRRSYDAVVRAVERALTAAHVDHVFVGGVAVLAFGRARTTEDVDVLADLREKDVPRLMVELRKRGLRVAEWDLRAAISEGSHCTVDDARSEYRLDLAPAVSFEARHSLRHRVRVRTQGVALPIAAPEHTIVMKLKFGSPQDLEDALAIYLRQKARLDVRAMTGFASRVGVLPELEDLRRKASELEDAQR